MIELRPLGDRGFLARFRDAASAVAWAQALRERCGVPIRDIVVAYDSVAVFPDPDALDGAALEPELRAIDGPEREGDIGIRHEIPVLYDGDDLESVARRLGVDREDLIEAHSGAEYRVQAIGFLPGFPYAGDLPDALQGLPRRVPPRTRVPAGSVAIAGSQTAIYPEASPGGWHLLGRTPLRIVDLKAGHFPIRVGDRLAFRPIGPDRFEALRGTPLPSAARPGPS